MLVTRIKTVENKTTYYIWNEKTEQQTEEFPVIEIWIILSLGVGKKRQLHENISPKETCVSKILQSEME